jgi:antitoxin (DNA-binding transcriptional repressor) of toxin-antitoxin stability system
MDSRSIVEAREQFDALTERVAAGEALTITKGGKAVAELRPVLMPEIT